MRDNVATGWFLGIRIKHGCCAVHLCNNLVCNDNSYTKLSNISRSQTRHYSMLMFPLSIHVPHQLVVASVVKIEPGAFAVQPILLFLRNQCDTRPLRYLL